jgi:hypothetical protein
MIAKRWLDPVPQTSGAGNSRRLWIDRRFQ